MSKSVLVSLISCGSTVGTSRVVAVFAVVVYAVQLSGVDVGWWWWWAKKQ